MKTTSSKSNLGSGENSDLNVAPSIISGPTKEKKLVSRLYDESYFPFGFTYIEELTEPISLCLGENIFHTVAQIAQWFQVNTKAISFQNKNINHYF